MATEETLAHEIAYNPDAIDVLFEALGRSNDCIIVDLPRSAFTVRQRVFEAATSIVLVTELSLSGLRDSLRILAGIEDVALGKTVTVVASRTGGSHQAMQIGDFQKALGHKIDLQIPEEPKAFHKAANNGKPLVQSDKNVKASKALRRMAGKLHITDSGEGEGKKKSKGSWRRVFKKKG
jgi:pilus assembly protein CpaE